MGRRSETISHVAIELREERYEAEWPAFSIITGCWALGLWKHRAVWCIETAIHFHMPVWRVVHTEHGYVIITGDAWREAEYVEYREHWVYARSREAAIGCLVRDLKADPRHEFISHAAIYRIQPPLTAAQVHRIETINTCLLRERAKRQERRVQAEQRQLEFA